MSNINKLFSILGIIVLIIGAVAAYIFFSDNYRTVKLPKDIVPVALDMSTAYLVPIDGGYLLVDTGYEKDYPRFLDILQKKGIQSNMIRYVFLTHHHDDHAGFLNQLTQDNSRIRIIMHEKAVPLLSAGANNINNGGGIVNPVIFGLFRLKQALSPEWTLTFPAFTIRPQDLLNAANFNLPEELGTNFSVLETPGHTTDSVSLLYKNEYLFCGDMASHFLNWAGAKNLTLFNEDVDSVYASWRNVLETGVKVLVPSHGKPFKAESLKRKPGPIQAKGLGQVLLKIMDQIVVGYDKIVHQGKMIFPVYFDLTPGACNSEISNAPGLFHEAFS